MFKLLTAAEWDAAQGRGQFEGSAIDLTDGYIHMSTGEQLAETASRHFRWVKDLMVLAVDIERIPSGLIWEPSRGGDLFPHLYGPLPLEAVLWVRDVALDQEGVPLIGDVIA